MTRPALLALLVAAACRQSRPPPEAGPRPDPAQAGQARDMCKQIYDVVKTWQVIGGLRPAPAHLRELETPIDPADDEPFFEVPRGPWGSLFRIERLSENRFVIWSNGPDLKPGTADDVRYPPAGGPR